MKLESSQEQTAELVVVEESSFYDDENATPPWLADGMNGSFFAKVSTANWFQHTTLTIIVLNALWIGADVEFNHPVYRKHPNDKLPLEPVSTIIENLFCVYFTIELTVRFFSYRRKCDSMKDRWFVFDGLLVLFMVIETWILEIVNAIMDQGGGGLLSKFSALRLLRLLRLTRMARLMRAVPELLTLVKGMISATRAVGFILMFLVLCMYVFSIVFTAQLGDPNAPERSYELPYWDSDSDPTGNELFGTLGDSMMTLFTRGMLADNLAETLQAIKDRGGEIECEGEGEPGFQASSEVCERTGGSLFLMWVFILFMIISAFCLLNMLIGVLCEVIQESAENEAEQMQITALKENMSAAFRLIDTSRDGLITKTEWEKMKLEKSVRSSMATLGVEEQHMEERLAQMQESLFGQMPDDDEEDNDKSPGPSMSTDNRNGLTFDEFIEKVIDIRPDMPASALDIELLRVRVEREEQMFNERLDFIEQALTQDGDLSAIENNKVNSSLPAITAGKVDVIDPTLGSAPNWLTEVPTEVLFAVLNSRTPPELGPPKLLTEGA
jgi:hypothetical protein